MTRRWGPKTSDATLTVGIKQGAGTTVTTPFDAGKPAPKRKPRKKPPAQMKQRKKRPGSNLAVWNAFAEPHLPLPRAVAPYSVVRTTAIWNPSSDNSRRFALFGPAMYESNDTGRWSNAYAYSSNAALDTALNTANGFARWCFEPMESLSWAAASVAPAAFSIQILNPEALQTSSGMVYIGRCKNKVNLSAGDLGNDIQSVCDNLVSYSNPRMCSAGKLALRGVQVDAVPNNMSMLADFTTLKQSSSGSFTLSATYGENMTGFNPIFLYNPNAVDLQVLVCCEWRVRFDPSNPAYATSRMHQPSTDRDWADHITRAVQMGSGVVDIVEQVSRLGRAVGAL